MLVSSSVGKIGDQVTLLSPTLILNEPTTCSFSYNMWLNSTDTTAALSLYAQSAFGTNFQQLFAAAGNRGQKWNPVQICLPPGTYRLAFVATVGFPFMSDIALDNVILHQNSPCDVDSMQQPQIQQTGIEAFFESQLIFFCTAAHKHSRKVYYSVFSLRQLKCLIILTCFLFATVQQLSRFALWVIISAIYDYSSQIMWLTFCREIKWHMRQIQQSTFLHDSVTHHFGKNIFKSELYAISTQCALCNIALIYITKRVRVTICETIGPRRL
jgi:MAM domain, meprin/A5/mu